MSRLPIPHFIQEIKAKLGFDRTMTASGDDVVDAVNKQSQQIGTKENKLIGRTVAISAATSSGTIGSISGDSAITSSMVVVASTITNPEYQTSEWTINTSNGGLTITGTASAATSVYIVLAEV